MALSVTFETTKDVFNSYLGIKEWSGFFGNRPTFWQKCSEWIFLASQTGFGIKKVPTTIDSTRIRETFIFRVAKGLRVSNFTIAC